MPPDPNPFPEIKLWDFRGNCKVVGSFFFAYRLGKGRGYPIQRIWLNEIEPPHRYGTGLGLRLPRLIVSLGRFKPMTTPEYFDHLQRHPEARVPIPTDISEWPTCPWVSGGDDVLADT